MNAHFEPLFINIKKSENMKFFQELNTRMNPSFTFYKKMHIHGMS